MGDAGAPLPHSLSALHGRAHAGCMAGCIEPLRARPHGFIRRRRAWGWRGRGRQPVLQLLAFGPWRRKARCAFLLHATCQSHDELGREREDRSRSLARGVVCRCEPRFSCSGAGSTHPAPSRFRAAAILLRGVGPSAEPSRSRSSRPGLSRPVSAPRGLTGLRLFAPWRLKPRRLCTTHHPFTPLRL